MDAVGRGAGLYCPRGTGHQLMGSLCPPCRSVSRTGAEFVTLTSKCTDHNTPRTHKENKPLFQRGQHRKLCKGSWNSSLFCIIKYLQCFNVYSFNLLNIYILYYLFTFYFMKYYLFNMY